MVLYYSSSNRLRHMLLMNLIIPLSELHGTLVLLVLIYVECYFWKLIASQGNLKDLVEGSFLQRRFNFISSISEPLYTNFLDFCSLGHNKWCRFLPKTCKDNFKIGSFLGGTLPYQEIWLRQSHFLVVFLLPKVEFYQSTLSLGGQLYESSFNCNCLLSTGPKSAWSLQWMKPSICRRLHRTVSYYSGCLVVVCVCVCV